MKVCLSSFFLGFLLLLCPAAAHADGVVRGSVVDSVTNTALIGANVYVVGTALGGVTDREGEFKINRVSPGTYTIRITYIGYNRKEFTLRVTDESTDPVRVRLSPTVVEGEEVVVTAQARGQVSAINQQVSSKTIINVISQEKIKELPDANAAEAIGRLPGVSLIRSGGEANKVILRGLSDKFAAITIDGVRMAATDSNARGVDLSAVSQGSLAGIELFKALTADKDGDAIAGGINLVTKKAPAAREIRIEAKNAYSKLRNTFEQYDFNGQYGERFFSNLLGVQVVGGIEQRDRSNEFIDLDYNTNLGGAGQDYEITDFNLGYTEETRKRWNLSLLLDFDTPDSGTVRFNNIFNRTNRDFMTYGRNYPTDNTDLVYNARNREIDIKNFSSSLRGENFLLGLTVNWGLAFNQSLSESPFDFYIDFIEPSASVGGVPISKMRNIPDNILKGPPELLIPYAFNNFDKAFMNYGIYRTEKNLDKRRSANLDLSRDYVLGDLFSGEIKVGGKYNVTNRRRENSEILSPYYLDPFREWSVLPNGTVGRKLTTLFVGTRFQNLRTDNGRILLPNFLDNPPANRDIYEKYALYPLIHRDALRQWYELNRNGRQDSLGRNPEFKENLEAMGSYYDIVERISAGYVMNTLNYGPDLTLIAGLRVENEENDYISRFSRGALTGFPVATGTVLDTSARHTETVWLPNFHLTYRPTEFLTIRGAIYKALARPDFSDRLERQIARSAGGTNISLFVGNPKLRAAQAWNYELNAMVYSGDLGLISVSGFYKEIKDMYRSVQGLPTKGNHMLDSLGIAWRTPFDTTVQYGLTFPLNSSSPTRVWGIEFEHQANLTWLPGLLSNLVLSYNFSLIRSETFVLATRVDTSYQIITVPGFPPIRVPIYSNNITESRQKLENQPEFFGNFAVGYDIDGFSARVSVFHQGSFKTLFSAYGRADQETDSYTRWDVSLKQRVTPNVSLLFNLNNFTNIEEATSIVNRNAGWDLLNTSRKYGLAADFGVRVDL